MLNVADIPSMLSVRYAECTYAEVANNPFMLSVVVLSVRYAECHFAECRGAVSVAYT